MSMVAHDRSGESMGTVSKVHIEEISSRARLSNNDTRVGLKLKYSEAVWVLVRSMCFFSIDKLPDVLIAVDDVIVVGNRILVLGYIKDEIISL